MDIVAKINQDRLNIPQNCQYYSHILMKINSFSCSGTTSRHFVYCSTNKLSHVGLLVQHELIPHPKGGLSPISHPLATAPAAIEVRDNH